LLKSSELGSELEPMSSELKDPMFHERLSRLIGSMPPFAWAEKIGIPKGTFSRVWNEGTVPGPEHLRRIAEKTGCSIDWLLRGEEENKIWCNPEPAPIVSERHTVYTTSKDPVLSEIISILENDLPEDKPFILKVLRGKKELKEGMSGLGLYRQDGEN